MGIEIIHGKCEAILPTLEAESFHACVTPAAARLGPIDVALLVAASGRHHRGPNSGPPVAP